MQFRVCLLVLLLACLAHVNSYKSFSSKLRQRQKRGTFQKTNVLILGAGMAGVTAANTLQAAGMKNFIVLEGSTKVGGRAFGATWVHGVEKNNNPLVAIANAANLKLYTTTNTSSFVARNSKGKDVTDNVALAMDKETAAETLMYKVASAKGITKDISIKEGLKTLGGWQASSAEEITAEYFNIDYLEAMPPHDVSVLGNMNNNEQEKFGKEGAYMVDYEGFMKGVRYLASQTFSTNDARLKFNEVVTEVHYDPENDKTIPAEAQNEGVYVVTSSGNTYWARYCIITFSNAVLLSGKVKFVPSLPDWKARALSLMKTAVYDKVIVKFAPNVAPFWDPAQWIFYVDSEKAYTRGYYTVWLNLTQQEIFPGSNMLQTFLVDEAAKESELKTDAQIKSEVTAVLRKMYGSGVPDPVSVTRSKLYANPWSLGAFHAIHVGVNSTDLDNFSEPVNNLKFAGDGADAEYYGLLNGAYKTGKKQATKVLKKLSKSQ